MTSREAPVFRLPARSLDSLLNELDSLSARVRQGEPLTLPTITLLLDSGDSVSGDFVSYVDRNVLIKNSDYKDSLTYAPLDAVRGVRVHGSWDSLVLLSLGKMRPTPERVPGRLEIERQLHHLAESLSRDLGKELDAAIAWSEIPTHDEAMAVLGQLASDLHAVLTELAADDMGKIALGQKVRHLALKPGSRLAVLLQDETLQILVGLSGPVLMAPSRARLRTDIEKAL